ncbi:serine/threonine protein kinase [Micromonospora acroterricola]|uniref:non-specific serine/threonine protein kinase n=1 Tax=Micromonospora acroterricola TaxID=2202421 RepID=A0A317CRZ7_9ACTN|nr:serine/threonine-protein kinase [Micromonospora acroterricola]PWR04932.1 serine/threonine protein kinase [Micromonospora acroterricola]
MSPFIPTLRLHDRYVLHERIGLGGMSEVWRADDEVLGRPVAVKVLAGQLAADPQLRATIQREARAAARLTHPHVTQVYDYAEATLPGGAVVPYLVMELVEGHNLADRLRAGPLPWPEAVRVAGQIAAALAAAHRIGVIHRDVKPGNVMLTDTGAKVLDFGIAALGGPHHPLGGQAGEPLMGTPAYFAPERLAAGPPDPASDVYALGALLYRTLTGQAPLPVQSWEDALEVHRRGTPVPPLRVPGLPADIAELTVACLAADPARRPTAARLATRFGAGQPVEPPTEMLRVPPSALSAHPPTLIDRSAARPHAAPVAAAPRRRSRRPLAVLTAAALAALIGVGALLSQNLDSPGSPQVAGPPATTTAPAPSPTTQSPSPAAPTSPPPASSAVPSTVGQQMPISLREVSAEFAAVLAQAQARGEIDRKTAEDLRDDLADLNRRSKDRDRRIADLRERIGELVDRDRLPARTGAQLDALLNQASGFSTGRDDD